MKLSASQTGFALGIAAYGIWGLFPLFFHLLREVAPIQVLTHRVLWSALFVALVLSVLGHWPGVRAAARQPAIWRALTLSSLLIGTNWLIFIYAVGQQQVLATSLGYFMTPLVSTALAVFFLGEALTPLRRLAILLVMVAIGWQLLRLEELPWISLCLALTFGIYGLVRKQTPVDTLPGLLLETLILLPAALLYWAWLSLTQASTFGQETTTSLLLMASGVMTALPLLAFAAAAKRLSLMAVGFMMYLNPTMQFFTAVWIFDEAISTDRLIGFACVWAALGVFSYDALMRHRKARATSVPAD